MKDNTGISLKFPAVALAVLLAIGGLVQPAAAVASTIPQTTVVDQYPGWGDPAMAGIAVNSGRALVNHLMTARALLDEGKVKQARSALLASREFADAIERMMPYLTVVEDMMDASDRVVREKTVALSDDLLPIYAGIDEMTVYAPEVARKTRGMLKESEKHARNGDREGAAKVIREAADEISRHTVYLPVTFVEQQIRVAQDALRQDKPDVKVARAAVNRSLDSLNVVIDSVIQTSAG